MAITAKLLDLWIESHQPSAEGSDPEHAGFIFVYVRHRSDVGIIHKPADGTLDFGQPIVLTAKPYLPGVVLDDGVYLARR